MKQIPPENVARIIGLHEKGFMQWEIAGMVGCSQMTVSRLLKKHNQRVFDILAQDHAAERGRQVRILVLMFREAMDEWQKSKKRQGKVKVIEEEVKLPGGERVRGHKNIRTEREVKAGLGNPAYLDRAQSILAAIREIMMMTKHNAMSGDEKPVVGENDVTKALERLNVMAAELKGETDEALFDFVAPGHPNHINGSSPVSAFNGEFDDPSDLTEIDEDED